MMKKISIKERLILYFVLLSVISIAIVSLFSIYEAKKGIRDRAFSQLILLRDLRREQVQAFYSTRGKELSAMAATENIREIADYLLEKKNRKFPQEIIIKDRQLIDLVMDGSTYTSMYIIINNDSTYRIYKTGDKFFVNIEPLYKIPNDKYSQLNHKESENRYEILEQESGANKISTLIISPLPGNNKSSSALLIMELNEEALQRIIFDRNPGNGLGKTGEAYLAGTDGYMRTPSRFIPQAIMNIRVETAGFNEALSGHESTGVYKDYRGIKVLGAYGRITTCNFTQVILAEIDVSEAMVPLVVIRNDILFVSLLILMVIFGITWFLAYGITRPLVRLKQAAHHISEGNYDQKLEIESDDEIGELTKAFNTMSEEVNSATKELKEKEESLRHFYEATLDGIVLHDDGIMVLFNSAMLKLTGYSAEEFSGFSLKDILRTTKEMLCGKVKENEMYETVLVCKNKSNLPVEVQDSCVEYDGKNIRASVIRDISSRKKMEAELTVERNKRIRAVFDGKDSEQQRLSRELHDGLGQQLVAGKLILESSLYEEGQNLKSKIIEVQNIFDQIIGDIRRISHDLSPSVLREFGLKAAMENLCKNIMKATGMIIDFHFDLEDHHPDELTSTYLFRIVQESLNNTQIHSGASQAKIILKTDPFGILLEIEDNGKGFDLKKVASSGGNGLYNIRERVNLLNGQLNIKSHPGKGTRILVRVPVNQPDS
jgi:PAS domain S-box-containing protein